MEKETKAIIIDDEPEAVNYLAQMLKDYFPGIEVVATANSSAEAVTKYLQKLPDLVFLDIQIDEQSGFDVIGQIYREKLKPHFIFVTAFNQYAVEAFKANAIDYLLKPVESEDLHRAVQRFLVQKKAERQYEDMVNLLNNYQPKLRFSTNSGFVLLSPNEIAYCKSDGNYSVLHLSDQSSLTVCLNLGNLLKMLPQGQFIRANRYNIVNEKYLVEVDRSARKCKLLVNGMAVSLKYSGRMFSK